MLCMELRGIIERSVYIHRTTAVFKDGIRKDHATIILVY